MAKPNPLLQLALEAAIEFGQWRLREELERAGVPLRRRQDRRLANEVEIEDGVSYIPPDGDRRGSE